MVRLVANMPILTHGDGIRRALDLLEQAIGKIPGASEAARAEAVRLMRAKDFDLWVAFRENGRDSRALHEALQVAAAAVETASKSTESRSAAADFKRATGEIDPARPIDDQHQQIVAAFQRAVTALEALQPDGSAAIAGERG